MDEIAVFVTRVFRLNGRTHYYGDCVRMPYALARHLSRLQAIEPMDGHGARTSPQHISKVNGIEANGSFPGVS